MAVLDPRARACFRKNRGAVVGLVLVALLVAFALLGPLLAKGDAFTSDFGGGVDAGTGMPRGPSAAHWLGTDRLYRDQLARLAVGARLSLLIGFAATAIASS